MARFILVFVLSMVLWRLFWRVVGSFLHGLNGSGETRKTQSPQRGVSMVRDPVCGTFLVPERAVTLVEGRTRLYFCSNSCRDSYRARTA